MPILDDFADLLNHTIVWEQRTAVATDGGADTYADPSVFTARIDFKRRNFTNARGQTIATLGMIVVGGTPRVQPGDRITLPDGSQPRILDAAVIDDFDGTGYFTQVTLG